MNTPQKKKKERKKGENLSDIFRNKLKDFKIRVKPQKDLEKINSQLTVQSENFYVINNRITYLTYGNSSGSENVRYERIWWGMKRKSLEEIAQIPNSLIIFLGGRNISKSDRNRVTLAKKLSPTLQEWLRLNLIEFVLIFSARDIWEELKEFAEIEPNRINWKFNYHLINPRFVGPKKNYLEILQSEIENIAMNRYDRLELPDQVIETLRNVYKPHFENIKQPWSLMQELNKKFPSKQVSKPPSHKLKEMIEIFPDTSSKKPLKNDKLEKKANDVITSLRKSEQLSSKPSEYVYDIATAFAYLGFETEIFDIPGDTDIVLNANLGEQSYRVIIDAKTSEKGKIIESRINWPAIMDHKEIREADYVGIVGKKFSLGRLSKRAEQFEVALITTKDLIRFIEIYTKSPFSLVTFRQLFHNFGTVKEETLEKIIIESQHGQKQLELIRELISKLGNMEKEDPEPKTDTLYYELERKFSLDEIRRAANFLSMFPLHILEYDQKTERIKLIHGKKGINDVFSRLHL